VSAVCKVPDKVPLYQDFWAQEGGAAADGRTVMKTPKKIANWKSLKKRGKGKLRKKRWTALYGLVGTHFEFGAFTLADSSFSLILDCFIACNEFA
jgi:hypothetical protein